MSRSGMRDMRAVWLRRWLLTATWASLLALVLACSSDDGATDAAGSPDDTTGADQQAKDDLSSHDVAVESLDDIHGQGVSGCVACHTDKDLLKELAPEEPEGEEEGGGG